METPPDQEDPEDNYTEVDENGDGVPEHYVLDWANQPVAATLIHLRETKINSLVEKVMFASYLGGELYKNGVQLNRVPFRANVLIPTSKVEQFLSGEGKLEYEGAIYDIYRKDWDTFVDYNIQDVLLIEKLEKKLKFILEWLQLILR
jgi:hypothetical protein